MDMETNNEMTAPTREQAIDGLVDLCVAKWGESERASARRQYSTLTHALALNALAYFDVDHPDLTTAKAAKLLMTAADRAALRKGG